MRKRIIAFAVTLCMCLTLLPMTVFADGGAAINSTNFPDEIFRKFVAEHYDTNTDGVLSDAERAAVLSIVVSGMGISSLKGIEHFPSLINLWCTDNELTELDLSKNTQLEHLFCYYNKLTTLDLSSNKKLEAAWTTVSPQIIETDASLNGFDLGALMGSANLPRIKSVEGGSLKNGIVSCSGAEFVYYYDTCSAEGNMQVKLSNSISINAANFPDEIFRKYVSENFDTDGNGALSASERDAVTTIDVSKKTPLHEKDRVSSLKGIEYFSRLWYLYCQYNNITSLDLSKNIGLVTLNCSGNRLTSLDLSKHTELYTLDCSSNGLTSLDLSKHTKLYTLDCSGNWLTSLDLSNNRELTELNCRSNMLTVLNTKNNGGLTKLDCSDNRLTVLDVTNSTALKTLKCDNNRLATLDLSNNKQLGYEGKIWPQHIELSVPLNGFDLKTLVGAANYSRVSPEYGETVNNGVIYTGKDEFSYYYDTYSKTAGLMLVTLKVGPQSKFTDAVPETHWAHDAIDYVLERGIMHGTGDNTFEPNGTLTRAMVVNMLYNLAGEPAHSTQNRFNDVPAGAWYADAVLWASESKIVSGKGDGIFDPNGAVTRQELANMMQNYAKYIGKDTSASEELDKFEDADTVSSWAIDAVKWACANGLISGSKDGEKLYLLPRGNATRAQIAVIFENFCEKFDI